MKRLTLLLLVLLYGIVAHAQPGIDEMQQARQDLSNSFFSALDCALVIAGIFGITGAIKIYHNWQAGKPRIDSDVAAWFYAALFMVLMGTFLRAIFGI
ncbi:DUF4134 family protein [Mucilaginibacter paludis]|uniref:Uncharacterized protein n=1 Tax=Mucilaginibacter paludis DSM 18603 TaxID=714943 RepID=H1YHN9_9SPHI|nr:DUF4134 family protein [Mucilaginibacter paludis]EHQ26462.1 hypothetical protein Mucpa_2332 [Mucilaginibacter paludis DSM 18603]